MAPLTPQHRTNSTPSGALSGGVRKTNSNPTFIEHLPLGKKPGEIVTQRDAAVAPITALIAAGE